MLVRQIEMFGSRNLMKSRTKRNESRHGGRAERTQRRNTARCAHYLGTPCCHTSPATSPSRRGWRRGWRWNWHSPLTHPARSHVADFELPVVSSRVWIGKALQGSYGVQRISRALHRKIVSLDCSSRTSPIAAALIEGGLCDDLALIDDFFRWHML